MIIDVMATLQALVSSATTFGEVTKQVFETTSFSLATNFSRVGFVVDQYQAVSIKTSERQQHSNECGAV